MANFLSYLLNYISSFFNNEVILDETETSIPSNSGTQTRRIQEAQVTEFNDSEADNSEIDVSDAGFIGLIKVVIHRTFDEKYYERQLIPVEPSGLESISRPFHFHEFQIFPRIFHCMLINSL